jgi:signal transduction histidine kinase
MKAAQQAALVELTQAVLANTELPDLMRRAVTLVARTLTLEYSAIWELLPDRSALVLRAGSGWQLDAEGQVTVGAGAASPAGYAVLRGVPVIVADWRDETRLNKPCVLRDHRVIGGLCVAIPGQDQPFGALSADSSACRTFAGAEILFLQAVANVLALAIERDQSNQAIEQQVEGRTRAIEQRLLAAAQNQAVLEERQRLARDLHDSVTQALYGITLHAQAAWRLLAADDVAVAADSLRALQAMAQEALDEMRLLIFELRPPILEQVGLVAALQGRLNAVEGRANLQTRLIADGICDLPSPVEQALYRIAQEALNNALKHAHAKHITVQLRQVRSCVELEIIDDGVGFDATVARENGGLGLRGIAERVAQLKGCLIVQSASGAGTQLRVELIL